VWILSQFDIISSSGTTYCVQDMYILIRPECLQLFERLILAKVALEKRYYLRRIVPRGSDLPNDHPTG
jgi:hypothetical protein